MRAQALIRSTGRRIVFRMPAIAITLAALALVCAVAAPLTWRTCLLPLKFSFLLLSGGGLLAIAAGVLALLALIIAGRSIGWPRATALCCVVLLGAAAVGVPIGVRRSHAPPINDITTDTENPPAIIMALPARRAEHAGTAVYGGPSLAQQQKAAYPDIAPLMLAIPAAKAFDLALNTAKGMSGWHIIATDPLVGRIEATQASFWFSFVDDIVIRVEPVSSGSRVDMRSHARQGRGDLGVNAARVRKYMAVLRTAALTAP